MIDHFRFAREWLEMRGEGGRALGMVESERRSRCERKSVKVRITIGEASKSSTYTQAQDKVPHFPLIWTCMSKCPSKRVFSSQPHLQVLVLVTVLYSPCPDVPLLL